MAKATGDGDEWLKECLSRFVVTLLISESGVCLGVRARKATTLRIGYMTVILADHVAAAACNSPNGIAVG
jgi:hypothetical protein